MLHDPERIAETKAWLTKAAEDLRAAELDLTANPPLIDDSLFHCQQAVEKSLKAFLTWHDHPFRKIHSIEEIGELCMEIDPLLSPLVDETAYMTGYAVAFRYPGEAVASSSMEAEESRFKARRVFLEIVSRLPKEMRLLAD